MTLVIHLRHDKSRPAGLNAKVAKEIVDQREREGAFKSRADIKKVYRDTTPKKKFKWNA